VKPDLRILHLEDNDADAELIALLLRRACVPCSLEQVQTREAFEAGLERGGYDLIFSDFSLPGFNGLDALALARVRRPEVPFLFVSGTIGEEVAIEALKSGATDYVLKDRMARLEPAVRRAMGEAARRAELKRAEEAMVQSEFKYRQIFECLCEAAVLADAATGRILDTNREAETLFGRPRGEILGLNLASLHPGMILEDYRNAFVRPAQVAGRITLEGEIIMKDGKRIPVEITVSPILLYGHRLLLGLYRDITSRKQLETEVQALRGRTKPEKPI
jgi:PAS domain S-box-containing protein